MSAILLVILLPFSWIVAKFSISYFGFEATAAYRVLVSFFALLVISKLRKNEEFFSIRDNFSKIALLSLLGFIGYFWLISYALSTLKPSQVGINMALLPAIGYGAAILLKVERLQLTKAIGLVIATVAAIYYAAGANVSGVISNGSGLLAAFFAAISYALYGVVYKKLLPKTLPLATLPALTGFSSLVLLVMLFAHGQQPSAAAIASKQIGLLVLLGAVFTAPIYYLYHDVIVRHGPVYANAIGLLTPFMVMLGESLFGFRNSLSSSESISMAICLFGVSIVFADTFYKKQLSFLKREFRSWQE